MNCIMKLKRILVLPVFAALFVIPFSGCIFRPSPETIDNGIEMCEKLCEIDLPDDTTVVYAAETVWWDAKDFDFVFSFNEELTELLTGFEEPDEKKNESTRMDLTFKTEDGAPSEAVADWSKTHLFCEPTVGTDSLCRYPRMAYFPDELKLFINISVSNTKFRQL